MTEEATLYHPYKGELQSGDYGWDPELGEQGHYGIYAEVYGSMVRGGHVGLTQCYRTREAARQAIGPTNGHQAIVGFKPWICPVCQLPAPVATADDPDAGVEVVVMHNTPGPYETRIELQDEWRTRWLCSSVFTWVVDQPTAYEALAACYNKKNEKPHVLGTYETQAKTSQGPYFQDFMPRLDEEDSGWLRNLRIVAIDREYVSGPAADDPLVLNIGDFLWEKKRSRRRKN